jgi:hypothetical protein
MNHDNYDQALEQISYLFASGALLMPVQGPPGTPAKIVNVCAPYGQKVVSWCAKRPNAMPTIPDPNPSSSNETLASSQIKPTVPTRTIGGGVEFMIEGQYNFLLTKPLGRNDTLPMGHMPLGVDPYTGNTTNGAPSAVPVYNITPSTYDVTWIPIATPTGNYSPPAGSIPIIVDRDNLKPA